MTLDEARDAVRALQVFKSRDALRVMRECTGLSQDAMAGVATVSKGTISFWETGRATPAGETAAMYLRTLVELVDAAGGPNSVAVHEWLTRIHAGPLTVSRMAYQANKADQKHADRVRRAKL